MSKLLDIPYFSKHAEKLLLSKKNLLNPKGELNVTQAAKEIGIGQTSLKRIIDGDVDSVSFKNEQMILKYLGYSKSDFYKYDDDNIHNMVREDATPYQVAREQLLSLSDEEFSDLLLFCEFLKWRKERDPPKS